MVKCRSWKCTKKQREIVDRIMNTVPRKYRSKYEDVKKHARPFITEKEWKDWRKRQ